MSKQNAPRHAAGNTPIAGDAPAVVDTSVAAPDANRGTPASGLRIGVMGGSFDPPHVGHLLLAQDAAEALALDRVIFIPAAQAPLKSAAPAVAADLRLAMLRAAVAAHIRAGGLDDAPPSAPGSASPFVPPSFSPAPPPSSASSSHLPAAPRRAAAWEVSDWEIRRGGESFSIHTARHLLALHPGAEIHWIIGADRLRDLHRWHRADELFELVRFAVAPRAAGCDSGESPARIAADAAAMADAPAGARVRHLPARQLDVSSTEIRARIRAGLPVDLFLPLPCLEIIQRHRLYWH